MNIFFLYKLKETTIKIPGVEFYWEINKFVEKIGNINTMVKGRVEINNSRQRKVK